MVDSEVKGAAKKRSIQRANIQAIIQGAGIYMEKMEKQAVRVGAAVQSAPYSPGIIAGGLVFVSGQVPMNQETKEVLRDDFDGEVRLCIANVERILKAAGTDLEHCVKVVVFLADMNNFARLNVVYNEYFGDTKPARSCVQVARLPLDVDVEIEAIAVLP